MPTPTREELQEQVEDLLALIEEAVDLLQSAFMEEEKSEAEA